MSVNEKMTAIADAIRDKTGGTEELSLDAMATEIQKVYDEGAKSEYDRFWDNVQRFGERTNYDRAFRYWDREYIRPKYKITATGAVTYLFCDCRHLKTVDPNDYDFSNMKPTFAGSGDAYAMFCRCYELEYVPDLGIPACTVNWMFTYCRKLHTIDVLRVSEKCEFDSTFADNTSLQNITIEGKIGKSIPFKNSPLTPASMKSVIKHLVDYSADETNRDKYTVTFKSTCWTALEADSTPADEGIEFDGTWREYVRSLGWNY